MSAPSDGPFRVQVRTPAEPAVIRVPVPEVAAVIRVSTPGPIGADAYAIWLAAGNTGSPADFLASLHGRDGNPGAPGPPGATQLPDIIDGGNF